MQNQQEDKTSEFVHATEFVETNKFHQMMDEMKGEISNLKTDLDELKQKVFEISVRLDERDKLIDKLIAMMQISRIW